MAKGKDPATCLTMNIAWTVAPWNIILQLVVGVYNIIFSFVKILKKIINFTLYYITIILIIIFKGIKLGCIPIRLFCNLPTDFGDPLWQIESSGIKTISQPDDLTDICLKSYKNYL